MQRWRTVVSKILGALLVAVITISDSVWDHDWEFVGSSLFLLGCALAAVGSLGRLWCSVYIGGKKTERLIVEGPYSISRNPLYFFSFIGALGVGLASETLTIPTLILVAFAVYYPSVIKAESGRLRRMYGEQYEDYAKKTPAFFPKISLLTEPEEYVVHPIRFRRDALSALWFIWLLGILEFIEGFREMGVFAPLFELY
ncbi:MAG: isoprenylcysteine carboxylmethyltransferase family protein [Candidatus Coatesbacteria bacterium]|nr:isoprenylcysteine carboxylmethyltransferase family protein [Candidatus Coatesbacteria bacterium]